MTLACTKEHAALHCGAFWVATTPRRATKDPGSPCPQDKLEPHPVESAENEMNAGVNFVQTVMELGSDTSEDSEEAELDRDAPNVEAMHTVDNIIRRVVDTVGSLWERGEETTAQIIACHLLQRGSQMEDACVHLAIHYQLADLFRPYTLQQPVRCEMPSKAWSDWYDETTRAIAVATTRLRKRRWEARTLNHNNAIHLEPPNRNDQMGRMSSPPPAGRGDISGDEVGFMAALARPTRSPSTRPVDQHLPGPKRSRTLRTHSKGWRTAGRRPGIRGGRGSNGGDPSRDTQRTDPHA